MFPIAHNLEKVSIQPVGDLLPGLSVIGATMQIRYPSQIECAVIRIVTLFDTPVAPRKGWRHIGPSRPGIGGTPKTRAFAGYEPALAIADVAGRIVQEEQAF